MADALGSGPSDRKVVRVQLPLPAPHQGSQTLWQGPDGGRPASWVALYRQEPVAMLDKQPIMVVS